MHTVYSHFKRRARVGHQLEAVGANNSAVVRHIVVNGAAAVGNWHDKRDALGAPRHDCGKRDCIRRQQQVTRAISTKPPSSCCGALDVAAKSNQNRDKL